MTRVGVNAVELLTCYQANSTSIVVEGKNRPINLLHTTHHLSNQQVQSGSRGAENRPSCT